MTMNLTVNGQPTQERQGLTVRQLIEQLGLSQRPVAVEVNREVIPRRQHEQVMLCEGDEIEVVTLVGGG